MRSCLRITAIILLIAIGAQFFQAAPWLLLVFGGVIAVVVLLNNQRKSQLEASTLDQLGQEPLGNILDAERGMSASYARTLLGTGTYDFEVVGESFYKQNFEAIQKNLNVSDDSDWDEVATLIADPGNLHSKNAVAVFISGLKLGYVPENQAELIYRFLLQNGGFAKADAALYFSASSGNSIWLDVARPYTFRS